MPKPKVILRLTCHACPEQYKAFVNDEEVAYLRLRHGFFRVDVPFDGDWITIYTAEPIGDGRFVNDERDYYLRFAVDAILKWLEAGRPGPPSLPPPAPEVEYEIEGAD